MEKVPLRTLGALAGPARTAVLLVDVQRVFAGLPLSPPVAGVLGNLRRFLDEARALGVPVVVVGEFWRLGPDKGYDPPAAVEIDADFVPVPVS